MKVGEYIRKKRKESGLTLKQLAEKIELSYTYLSQIELGDRTASPEILKKIAEHTSNAPYEILLELGGYKDLANFEILKQSDNEMYVDQLKTAEDAVEWLNMMWAKENESYKLVIEKNGDESPIYIDEVLKESTKLYFKENELTNEEREKLYAILEIVYK